MTVGAYIPGVIDRRYKRAIGILPMVTSIGGQDARASLEINQPSTLR